MPKLFETPSEKSARDPSHSFRSIAQEFSVEERRVLLEIAHEAILASVEERQAREIVPLPEGLAPPRGVFTTLYLNGQLRGCVGYAVPVAPLYLAVAQTALAAAFQDTRFTPVTAEEAPRLKISLSVLSGLRPIEPEKVRIGQHGLVISQGLRRGLLLPQVPVEHAWDRETFFDQTCRKAGLPTDAWRHGALIEAFTAEVFGDGNLDGTERP
jgi:AmmeMemoRadiSam system protein A